MIEIEDRHRELLRTLAGAKVQFVLVGGVALQLRGADLNIETRLELDLGSLARPGVVVADATDFSEVTAHRLLTTLEKARLIERHGRGRGMKRV